VRESRTYGSVWVTARKGGSYHDRSKSEQAMYIREWGDGLLDEPPDPVTRGSPNS